MLQAEEEASRELLVEILARVLTPQASVALAQRALYDPSPKVRETAVEYLNGRERVEYRDTLLAGFRHPWATVADHAAEALVAVGDVGAIPALKQLVDKPDPALAVRQPGQEERLYIVREMVRVNHLRNCLLCHAPSSNGRDDLRGFVPESDKPLPLSIQYYDPRFKDGVFVRADVTYLRQDFSVMQKVENAKPWPEQQRFDFLVRTREATPEEVDAARNPPATYPQREAVLWAIAELEARAKANKPKE
jgi:hypothetical protein